MNETKGNDEMNTNGEKFDRLGRRIDFNESDVEVCRKSFFTCEAGLRFKYDEALAIHGAEATIIPFEEAVKKSIRVALEDNAFYSFCDEGDEDTPTEKASNGRLIDLGAVLSYAEESIGECAMWNSNRKAA